MNKTTPKTDRPRYSLAKKKIINKTIAKREAANKERYMSQNPFSAYEIDASYTPGRHAKKAPRAREGNGG